MGYLVEVDQEIRGSDTWGMFVIKECIASTSITAGVRIDNIRSEGKRSI